MGRSETHITDAELEVLKVLWAGESFTIREITGRVYPGGGPSHYSTVQKLLDRLEAKGAVRRRSGGRAHRFESAIDREALVASRLEETARRLCEGSFTPLVAQLVDSRRLRSEDVDSLRRLVDRLESERDAGDES